VTIPTAHRTRGPFSLGLRHDFADAGQKSIEIR